MDGLAMLWVQIPPATLVMGSNPTSCNQFAGLFYYFLGTFGCDTGMKLPDDIKPMTGFQIGNSVLLPEGPAGLGPAQKMRKMRPWLLSDVNTALSSGSLVHRQTRRLTGDRGSLKALRCARWIRLGGLESLESHQRSIMGR